MMRSEVKRIRQQLKPFHFNYEAIEPRAKIFYPGIDAWECLRSDGNIAGGYDSHRHIILDMDRQTIPLALKSVFERTAIVKSAKGYGIVLKGPVPRSIYSALRAYMLEQKGRKYDVNAEDLERAIPIINRLKRLGIKDDTAFHGLFPSADGKTYYLLPPSRTCRYHGRKGRVRNHSSQLAICNHAPKKNMPHVWVQRTWYRFTYDLMSVAEFFEIVGVPN